MKCCICKTEDAINVFCDEEESEVFDKPICQQCTDDKASRQTLETMRKFHVRGIANFGLTIRNSWL